MSEKLILKTLKTQTGFIRVIFLVSEKSSRQNGV